MKRKIRPLYVALPVGMRSVAWETDCMINAFPIPKLSIHQEIVSYFGQKKQGISLRCIRNIVTSIGRRNPILSKEGSSWYSMQEILPLLILVVAAIGCILYDKCLYKRAKKQGKKYYISPISLKKYRIY